MNIFKVLANGYGKIYENAISAFLGYILDPKGDHGLNDSFLKLFLEPLSIRYPEANIPYENLSINSNYTVDVYFEKEFYLKEESQNGFNTILATGGKTSQQNNKPQRIDLILKISKKPNDIKNGSVIVAKSSPELLILIENKINNAAFTETQIVDQQDELRKQFVALRDPLLKTLIDNSYTIYVTPEHYQYSNSIRKATSMDNPRVIKGVHICWNSIKGSYDGNIPSMIDKLFTKELDGTMEPMNEVTRHTLRAFRNFIKSGFKSKFEEEKGLNYDTNLIFKELNTHKKEYFSLTKKWYDLIQLNFSDLNLRKGKSNGNIAFDFQMGSKKVAFQIFFSDKKNLKIQFKDEILNGINLEQRGWKISGRNWVKKIRLDSEEIDPKDIDTVIEVISSAVNK